jgi:predicted  nucleic acid-binding Zn-ribbon protein
MEGPVSARELAARRIEALNENIMELLDNIDQYDANIEEEKGKRVPDQDSIKGWRETSKEWIEMLKELRELHKSLRKALDLEIERERAPLENRFSNLSVNEPGFFLFCVVAFF